MKFINAKRIDSHIDAIYSILRSCGLDMYEKNGLTHWLKPYPKESISRDVEGKNVFLVEFEGRMVATFAIELQEKCAYLSKLAVLPKFSGGGIGGKCLVFAENFAIENNRFNIELDVYDKSKHAINFYLKNGFGIIGNKSTTNFSVLLMKKELISSDI